MKKILLLMFLISTLAATGIFAGQRPFSVYTVKGGDTLESVAREHGVETPNLAAANGIGSAEGLPPPGTTLLIPNTPGDVLATLYEAKRRGLGAWPKPKYADEFLEPLTDLADKGSEEPAPQKEETKGETPAPAPDKPVGDTERQPAGNKHKVAEGETPYGIARLYKISLAALLQANGLSENPVIHIGQELLIPEDSTLPRKAEPPSPSVAEKPKEEIKPSQPPTSTAPGAKMIWPLKGGTPPVLTGTSFGEGLATRASPGEAVLAAADATVLHGGWMRNFGNAVYLNHGEGIATFYGGLGILYVKSGDKVRQGERIAVIGEAQDSEAKFVFHVLKEGKSVDPTPWLQ